MINNTVLNDLARNHTREVEKICFDGMFNNEEYVKAKKKIVFLLKERNGTKRNGEELPDSEVDLIKVIQQEFDKNDVANMWLRLYDWTNIAIAEDSYWSYRENSIKKILSKEKPVKVDSLNAVAILNLNKNFGGSVAGKEYFEKAKEWSKVWKEQLKMLNPDLVICCGTYYETLKEFDSEEERENVLETGAEVFCIKINENEVPFLEFFHPGCRLSDRVLAAYFKESIQCLVDFKK